jgi:hypothetical protein
VTLAVKRVARHEAAVMARLHHPNIVRVVDVVDDGDGDEVAVVMQLADGGSLASRVPLAADEAVRVALDVCDALSFAHAHGVLHLDVKPANVLLAADGHVLLADFGAPGRGTAGFAAPEQERDEPVDERADVHGVGALLGALVGGAPVSAGLAHVVRRAMARDPEQRFASIDDLACALRVADLDGADDVLPTVGRDGGTRPFGPRPPQRTPLVAHAPASRRRRVWCVALLVVLALVLGAGAVIGVRGGSTARVCQPVATPKVADAARSEVLWADVDGDGCTEPLVRTGNVLSRGGGLRFSVGDPGDVVLVGDWDCDGVATVGVWRPGTGEAFVFDGWAAAGGGALTPVSRRPGGGPPRPCRG